MGRGSGGEDDRGVPDLTEPSNLGIEGQQFGRTEEAAQVVQAFRGIEIDVEPIVVFGHCDVAVAERVGLLADLGSSGRGA